MSVRRRLAHRSLSPSNDQPPGASRLRAPCGRAARAVGFRWNTTTTSGRTSVVARPAARRRRALCLTGHIDTVASARPGRRMLLRDRGRPLYGRGTPNESRVAAADRRERLHPAGRNAGTGIVYAAEKAGASARSILAHAAVWARPARWWSGSDVELSVRRAQGLGEVPRELHGVSAHGSMPQLGVNAITRRRGGLGARVFDFGAGRIR